MSASIYSIYIASFLLNSFVSETFASECNLQLAATGGKAPVIFSEVTPQLSDPELIPGEIIVRFSDASSTRTLAPSLLTITTLVNVRISADFDAPTPPGFVLYRVFSASALSIEDMKKQTKEVAQRVSELPGVLYAVPNILLTMQTIDDPCSKYQWHYLNRGGLRYQSAGGVAIERAWEVSKGSHSTVIAVVDTGIDIANSDIDRSRILPGYDFVDEDSDPTDPGIQTYYHGTHVAGVVGALTNNNAEGAASINWDVSVLPVRVLGSGGMGSLLATVNGIRWAAGLPIDGVSVNPNPAKIINVSLGAPPGCQHPFARPLQEAINDAHSQGALIVAAAGNSSHEARDFVPASCEHVIAVAASDASGRLVTRYSNYGQRIDILAPGGDVKIDANNDGVLDGVLSVVPDGFALYDGTSMAAPHVSGVAALAAALDPALSPDDLGQLLLSTAVPRSLLECPKLCGAGLLDAGAALEKINGKRRGPAR